MKTITSVVLSIILTTTIFAQNYPKRDGVDYDDLIRKYPTPSTTELDRYQSPYLLPDTTARLEQEQSKFQARAAHSDSSKTELFGYNLFARGGSTNEIPQNLALPDDYTLGPGDNLIVNLWGRVEQEYNLTVDRQGAVFIPKIGEVAVWGQTLQQAERRLREKLGTGFSDFQMTLSLGKLKSIQVFVFGEVKYPGSYSVNSLSTMFSALYLAGGPTDRGSLRRIKLIRSGVETASIDLYQFLLFGKNVAGVSLQSGDVVFVEVVGKRVKVEGAIKRPAIYEILGNETITEMVELAGGTLPSAYVEKVRIDRVASNDAYNVIDLDLKDSNSVDRSFAMEDGDEVSIESIYDHRQDVVYLEGHFRHPGLYQYQEGLTLAQLFKNGCDLEEQAYRGRIDLLRCENGKDTSLITVNPEEILNGANEVPLRAGDKLIAYAREDVTAARKVSIFGQVTRPGEYAYYQGMKVSDLVFKAGNMMQSAYPLRIELARTMVDGQREVYYASLDEPTGDMTLSENDKIFVRQIPGWEDRDIVTIEGEVVFAGKYVISQETNSLYSLIQRAGGLTDDAFATGTVFTRATIISDLKRRGVDELINRSAQKVEDDSGHIRIDSTSVLRDNNMSNRIVVHIDELLKNGDLRYDVKLKDGDHIYIPSKPAGIQVLGAVPSISTIAFQDGKKADFYLKRAGGFLPNADKKHVQLARADGTIVSGRGSLSKEVRLGDAIFVPTRVHKERDWLKFFSTTASVAASIATTIFVVDRL
ncbi:MAG: SLBB domain-containing protein [Candidatus Zixiibacteriota bacterium]